MTTLAADARDRDREFMRQALLQAERGRATASPNPMVGCVLVAPDGVVVGRGYHERAGGPHAEVGALRQAGGRARGATMYVTLEPCSHTGRRRTGPCVVPTVEAGVVRVVAAMQDPNPRVAGQGFAYLRQHGVVVDVGVLEDAARELNAAFVTAMTLGRPFVLLKVAASSDARIAAAPGGRTALTSGPANLRVQGTRAWVDAIMIGAGTALADDPRLTARDVWRDRPLLRVLIDWRLRVPRSAHLFAAIDGAPVMVVAGADAAAERAEHVADLRARGVEVFESAPRDLGAVLAELHRREIRSVLVEGGAMLHRALVEAGLADQLDLYVTPHVLGPGGVAWDVPLAWTGPPRLVLPMGPDVLIEYGLGAGDWGLGTGGLEFQAGG